MFNTLSLMNQNHTCLINHKSNLEFPSKMTMIVIFFILFAFNNKLIVLSNWLFGSSGEIGDSLTFLGGGNIATNMAM